MSLDVSPDLLAAAERGEIDDADFVQTVRTSLPYAWSTVARVAAQLETETADFADNQTPPPDETARGELLRALASDAIRGALERHFGVRLAFQNCHRVAAFRFAAVEDETYRDFVSTRAQVLNQSPLLRNC
ncbi:MAG: SCO5389 family protein [Nocardioidaceae bacterium]